MGVTFIDGDDWDAHGSWTKKTVACDAFHPYTSNPLLCKCGHPVQEHTTFMRQYNERMEDERQRREAVKSSAMEVLGVELIPEPDEEMIEIRPGWTMKRREYEALRQIIQNEIDGNDTDRDGERQDGKVFVLPRWRALVQDRGRI